MSRAIEQRMADIIAEELSSFVEWCGKEWTLTKEMAAKDPELRELTGDYLNGYNAALEGLKLALDSYRDEVGP
ncbi:hypothetical protein [Rhizobium sp. Root149]|uniref:hypothetical protein n=1 Tax=Rhizobium sp. Root149 TaxID=1736473 RepID=UPI000A9368F4|nr:hypothetical protein [Rhizobium sp. Root149]